MMSIKVIHERKIKMVKFKLKKFLVPVLGLLLVGGGVMAII